jgi:N-methylhydantoinase B
MAEGDAYLTNDPWMGTGHLHDFTVLTPAFLDGRPVALFADTVHVVDIGGLGFGADGRQVYEEGINIPIMPLVRQGRMNDVLLEILRANVREPQQVVGDLHSLAAANETGVQRLCAMLRELDPRTLDELAAHIIESSRAAMLEEIRTLPFDSYENAMRVDGHERPVDLVAKLTIGETGIDIDFSGTSPTSSYGINVPLTYTQAYASFGVRCLIGSSVPNNAGSLEPIRVSAPAGSILNAERPAAVSVRHVIGQMLPDVVLGCLAKATGGRVPAEGSSSLWNPVLLGGPGLSGEGDGPASAPFAVNLFHAGGTGARPVKDGMSATAFPSGVRNTPIEINETLAPLVVWKKEFLSDSGGPGRYRGGLGQVMEVAHRHGAAFSISALFDRIDHPARGREGGLPGAPPARRSGQSPPEERPAAQRQGTAGRPSRGDPGHGDAGRRRLRRSLDPTGRRRRRGRDQRLRLVRERGTRLRRGIDPRGQGRPGTHPCPARQVDRRSGLSVGAATRHGLASRHLQEARHAPDRLFDVFLPDRLFDVFLAVGVGKAQVAPALGPEVAPGEHRHAGLFQQPVGQQFVIEPGAGDIGKDVKGPARNQAGYPRQAI